MSKIVSYTITVFAFVDLSETINVVYEIIKTSELPKYFNQVIFSLFVSGFELYIIGNILIQKRYRYKFTNYKMSFHPFLYEMFNYIGFVLLTFVYWLIFLFVDKKHNDNNDPIIIIYFIFITTFLGIRDRKRKLNKLPIEVLKSRKLRLILKYEDYMNQKITGDEPFITVNQMFEVSMKKYPRNLSERNTIEIKNGQTPSSPALVSKIDDEGLADSIRDGNILHVQLVDIKDFGELEVELWIQEKESTNLI